MSLLETAGSEGASETRARAHTVAVWVTREHAVRVMHTPQCTVDGVHWMPRSVVRAAVRDWEGSEGGCSAIRN